MQYFGVLIFLAVIGIFAYVIINAISTWVRNNNSPVETYNAVVVAKRTNVSGGGKDSSASTSYHVTFQLEDNSRLELGVHAPEYGALAEGDVGVLTRQGTRFLGFERTNDEYSAIDPNQQVHTCKGCGATFRGTVCDYCGTPVETVQRSRRRL